MHFYDIINFINSINLDDACRKSDAAEGVTLSGVLLKNKDCKLIVLWRSPPEKSSAGAEGARRYPLNLSGKRTKLLSSFSDFIKVSFAGLLLQPGLIYLKGNVYASVF